MVTGGLREVSNPSELFLGDRDAYGPGAAVFAGVEGTRPMLVEIQALVAPSGLGTPRRAVVGWDANRLSMLLAVLETRCGISFSGHDVYLNVAGGLKITEPAADLAAAAALLSSISGVALPRDAVYFGEVSLVWRGSGRRRMMTSRLKEASKLGFHAGRIAGIGRCRHCRPEAQALPHRTREGPCGASPDVRLSMRVQTCISYALRHGWAQAFRGRTVQQRDPRP